MTDPPDISIVLPAYKAVDHIRRVVPQMMDAVSTLGLSLEILLVVNGPDDGTGATADALRDRDPRVQVLRARQSGWGRAVGMGLGAASGKLLAYTNLARTPPEVLRTAVALAAAVPGSVVKANRRVRDNFVRRAGSVLYNLECRLLFELSVFDVNGTPKVFPAEYTALRQLRRVDDMIDAEFVATCNALDYQMVEFAVGPLPRHSGTSTTNFTSAWNMYTQAFALRRDLQRRLPSFVQERGAGMNGSALVTGGAGFIGANVVRRLADDGLEVHVLTRQQTDRWRLAGLERVRTHVCPLEDSGRVDELVATIRPEWVFHLAAHGAYASQTDSRRIVAVNTLGTLNLLDAVAETGACAGFVHAGSSSEYGLKDHAPSEDEIVAPDSVYAVTKCAATHAVSHWARTTGLAAATVRLYSVYGRWEEPTRLMPRLIMCALAGTLPVLTSPSTARDFLWIDDAVEGIVRAAREASRRPGAVWNLGSGEQTTLDDLVATVRSVFGVNEEPSWGTMPDRSWDTASWRSDPRRARVELGWEAETRLDRGLRETAQWLSETPARARYAACV